MTANGTMWRTWRRARGRVIRTTLALCGLLLALPLLLWLLGFDPRPALIAFWSGSIGSSYAFTSGTLVRATPLILTGLSVALAFRAGVFNIGAEGQFLLGASAAAAVALIPSYSSTRVTVVLALVAGGLAGALWAAIAALLRARFHVLEVLSTILLNFVGLYIVSYLVRGPLQEPLHIYPQSASVPLAARLPRFGNASRLHAGFFLALLACLATWWFLRFTAAGFRIRASGANPDAARSAGQIDVVRATTRAFLASGALAGLAGAIELTGVTYALYENISPGYGYTGIAVALLARLDPLWVIGTGLLFGALEAGGAAMQRDAGVPSVAVSVVEALIILGTLIVWPAALEAEKGGAVEPIASSNSIGSA